MALNEFALSVLDTIPNLGVFVFDEFYRYHLLRGPLHVATGYHPEQCEGKTLYEVLPENTWDTIEQMYDRALSGETFDTTYTSPETGIIYYCSFYPMTKKGGRYGVGVVRDVTDLIVSERQSVQAENKESLSVLAGQFHRETVETLIHLIDELGEHDSAREKAHEVFSQLSGLQVVAGNMLYDFEPLSLDSIVAKAHAKTQPPLDMDLHGSKIVGDEMKLRKAFLEIFRDIETPGFVRTKGNKVDITFLPPRTPGGFGFQVAKTILEAHGASIREVYSRKAIKIKIRGLQYA